MTEEQEVSGFGFRVSAQKGPSEPIPDTREQEVSGFGFRVSAQKGPSEPKPDTRDLEPSSEFSEFEAFRRELEVFLLEPGPFRIRTERQTRLELLLPRRPRPQAPASTALGQAAAELLVRSGINPNRQRVGKSGELPRRGRAR